MKRCPNCNGSIIRLGNKEKPFLCKTCNEWFSDEEVTPKQTNADRIRAMSDEELAMWLTDFCCATVGNAAEARVAMYHCGMLEYLKQPPDSLSEIGQNTTSGCGKCDKCRINDTGTCRYGDENT